MGQILDIIKEIPLPAELSEKLADADRKFEEASALIRELSTKNAALQQENTKLRVETADLIQVWNSSFHCLQRSKGLGRSGSYHLPRTRSSASSS